ncbi:hypothetical protein CBS101457_003385 [Exobasidium rhododendri]|nr:hypothetical protein CBS101457_003385 [Exobasidium rhododendri]
MPLPSHSFAINDQNLPRSAEEARSLGLQLAQERKIIDDEVYSLVKALQEQGATMTSPLVDRQGFPVATIDIVAVRGARSRIIALRNDREKVERRMQGALEIALARSGDSQEDVSAAGERHDSAAGTSQTGRAWGRVDGRRDGVSMLVETQEGDVGDWMQVGGLEAFARVNTVADSSPAQTADLCRDDEVLRFGELDSTTAHQSIARRDLRNLPSVVQEGKEISVVVLRKDRSGQKTIKRLRLTPSTAWGGQGLLGCHLVPI